jgi:hypothetical protein
MFTARLSKVSYNFNNVYGFRLTEHQRAWSHMIHVLAPSHVHIDDWFPHSAEVSECRPVSLDLYRQMLKDTTGTPQLLCCSPCGKNRTNTNFDPSEFGAWTCRGLIWCLQQFCENYEKANVFFQTAAVTTFCPSNTNNLLRTWLFWYVVRRTVQEFYKFYTRKTYKELNMC